MRRWGRVEKNSWTDRVKNQEILHIVKEERNILHTVKTRKVKWIGRFLVCNCFLKHTVKGKIKER
jgi:hypothetical protein